MRLHICRFLIRPALIRPALIRPLRLRVAALGADIAACAPRPSPVRSSRQCAALRGLRRLFHAAGNGMRNGRVWVNPPHVRAAPMRRPAFSCLQASLHGSDSCADAFAPHIDVRDVRGGDQAVRKRLASFQKML